MNEPNHDLRAVRIRRGHTQLSLARLAGCSEMQVSYMETGRRRPSAALRSRIAGALAIDEVKIFPEGGVQ